MGTGAQNDFGVSLAHLANIRDLGGIATSDGRHVKQGSLIRSEMLCAAADEELVRLTEDFDLYAVVDFRMDDERKKQSDPMDKLPGARLVHAPIINPASLGGRDGEELDPATTIKLFQADFAGIMGRMYTDMVLQERGQAGFALFFQTLLESSDRAVLWHCTAGKDRTGMATALLLSALGASDEAIMDDYLASNELLKPHSRTVGEALARQGMDEATIELAVRATCTVTPVFLQIAFSAIKDGFGSVDVYLTEALHVTPEQQETLCGRYLV